MKNLSMYQRSIVLLFLTVIFWGSSFISAKIVLNNIPPLSLAFLRQVIGTLILLLIIVFTGAFQKIRKEDILRLIFGGVFGVVLYNILQNFALRYTSVSLVSVIVSTAPIFTILFQSLVLKTRIDKTTLFYVFFSVTGVYFLSCPDGKIDFSSNNFFGDILMLMAVISWVIYTFINGKLTKNYSELSIIFYQSLFASILFVPFVLSETHTWMNLTYSSVLHLFFLGVFASALAYLFFLKAVKNLGTTTPTVMLNLIPVIAVILAITILGERLTYYQVLGIVIVVACVYKVTSIQVNMDKK